MIINEIVNEYFDWMYDLVCERRHSDGISYRKLLMYLYQTEFVYSIPMDENRADDGINLRNRFAAIAGYDDFHDYLDGPCTILEMMIALALRCEETIMDNPQLGNRTSQWFWNMVVSLGLGGITDDLFDKDYVDETIDIFLNREYERNGKGGLFTVRNCDRDMRNLEIWTQMCLFLDSIE